VPFSAIYWFSSERFKLQWKDRIEHHHPTLVQQAGAAAGMIAAACTAPFDVVKTWRQTNLMMINKLTEFEEVNLHP
jgi:Mitochondrial carrier protein